MSLLQLEFKQKPLQKLEIEGQRPGLPGACFFLYNRYMIIRFKLIFVLWLMIATLPLQSEASFAGNALEKARNVMQSAFQLSFLNRLPVVFYKNHFSTMFTHANSSIDQMNLKYGDRTVTRNDFQDDKALHIKKSAELALHIQSLIGSKHLAYGITMAIGLIKEAIDGSFLNPKGSRSKEDIYADHVGARAVFGKEKFDKSLNKYLGNFVKPDSVSSPSPAAPAVSAAEPVTQVNPFSAEPVNIGVNQAGGNARQQLLKQYYEAAEKGDSATMNRLGAELKALP